jgi:hypothetical protein
MNAAPLRRPAVRASPSAALELAEVVRRHAHRLGDDVSGEQRRILRAIAACRTAALGGHVEACDHCHHRRIAYNSCRNRHCPRCRASACAGWMEQRAAELLPVEYFHVVFTLPDEFNALAVSNRRVVYGVLFAAVGQTLLEVAANPKRLGARIGFIAILHTWGQNLSLHPHVHCVVPGGGLSPDGSKWISCRPGFFLPVRVLSRVFRGKFIEGLRRARARGKLTGWDRCAFERLLDASMRHDWVVYAKPPFGGPTQVLKYLARYTHRIAISNRRLVANDDRTVTFTYKNYARGQRRRTMTLDGAEFLRRFLLHAVPPGFMRIRHFGLLANRVRAANLQRCRQRLAVEPPPPDATDPPPRDREATGRHERCPICGIGRLIPGPRLAPPELQRLLLRLDDTS